MSDDARRWPPVRPRYPARRPQDAPPVLLCVIDTEEGFDWSGPFDREARDVSAIQELPRFQDVVDAAGAKATYVIDHPVAASPDSARVMRMLAEERGAEIGAHLHPWVTPPYEEEVCARNSYPGNLARALEREKLAGLKSVIEDAVGVTPRSYKSGRYGGGANTPSILSELGFEVDASVASPFDFRGDDGPDYRASPVDAFWLDAPGGLLEAPTTGGYFGYAGALGAAVDRVLGGHGGAAQLARGVLSKAGAATRARLSPEGYSFADLRALTESLLARGVKTFSFSLHSPSVAPGFTPYAQSSVGVARLLELCRAYFEYFLKDVGGVAMTASEFRRACLADLGDGGPRDGAGEPRRP